MRGKMINRTTFVTLEASSLTVRPLGFKLILGKEVANETIVPITSIKLRGINIPVNQQGIRYSPHDPAQYQKQRQHLSFFEQHEPNRL